jgi:hypothetical protein
MINRFYPILFGLVLGIAIGLLYGWVIKPVEIVESTPDTLRDDHRTDLILMIAEAYEDEADLDLALQRFKRLELEPPAVMLEFAITYANDHKYKVIEIQRMSELLSALEINNVSP